MKPTKQSKIIGQPSTEADGPELVMQQIVEAASLPLSKAVTMPRAAYISDAFFQLETERIFSAEWMCVGHVSQVKSPGSYATVDLLGHPLVIVRGQDDGIRVLSRVCPHRGTDIFDQCFGQPQSGVTQKLVCPYHAWAFDLTGELKAAPEMHKSEGFEKSDWRLAEFRSGVWEGFIFVNLDGQAAPLAEQYEGLHSQVAAWNMKDMEVVISMDWECDFNWKVMIENWMEPYHHIGIHKETIQPDMPARMTKTESEHPHFFQCHLYFRKDLAETIREAAKIGDALDGFKPISALSVEQQVEWGLFLGYPCFMILTARDRVLWYRLEPLSANRCRLITTTMVSKEAISQPDFSTVLESATKLLSDFHSEDMQVNAAVQHGLRSSHAVRGRLSYLEEPIWLFQRYLAARLQRSHPQNLRLQSAA